MADYKHGKIEYSPEPSGLSFQHRTDPDNPLPEHGSHTQGQHRERLKIIARGHSSRPKNQIRRYVTKLAAHFKKSQNDV